MEDQFCSYQEKVTKLQFDKTPKVVIVCNCAPDRKTCPYTKAKKAKIKCEMYKRSLHD